MDGEDRARRGPAAGARRREGGDAGLVAAQEKAGDPRPVRCEVGINPDLALGRECGAQEPQDLSPLETPDWFDADAFVAEAPKHFEQLQRAWDAQNWEEISEYTSAELLAQLKTNRSVLPDQQTTEVVSCMAEIVGFNQSRAETVVSINFHGWIKEQGDDQTTEFSEIWHLSRVADEDGVNWVIVGIEQP